MLNVAHDERMKIQALIMMSCSLAASQVAEIVHISKSQLNQLCKKAIDHDWGSHRDDILLLQHIQNAECSKCSVSHSEGSDAALKALIEADKKSCTSLIEDLADEISMSVSVIQRRLCKMSFKRVKPSFKSGLIKEMCRVCLNWCQKHKNWILKNWKSVIWTDEISVILSQWWENHWVWQTAEQQYDKTVVVLKWNEASEFMFWESFTYEEKGSCYCWFLKTAADKKKTEKDIKEINVLAESTLCIAWELKTDMHRLRLQIKSEKVLKWCFIKVTEKLIKERRKEGINWYRYRQKILLSLLLLFTKHCMKQRSETVIQEDRASAHRHHAQQALFNLHSVLCLLWPGNSSDLNMIKPVWVYLKHKIITQSASCNEKNVRCHWETEWKALSLSQIRHWIEQIPEAIQWVIALKDRNEYCEEKDINDVRLKKAAVGRKRHQWHRQQRQAQREGHLIVFNAVKKQKWLQKRRWDINNCILTE